MKPIGLTVLGSTGSIGRSTLDVVARHPDRFRVVALTAQRDDARLLEQVITFRPDHAVLLDAAAAQRLGAAVRAAGLPTQVHAGAAALEQVAALPEAEAVMAAIVGAAGLLPTLAAAQAGKRVLLANKEALVMSGRLLMTAVANHGATLLPIDSEHNAIFQCLPQDLPGGPAAGREPRGVRRLLLTASGGPFLRRGADTLATVTPEEACRHPKWSMGRKISVDSATLMNKGLELIEACWLFGLPPARIEIVVHPQSIVHSLVDYVDGSVLAQLGAPDMRTPIAQALGWPERIESGVAPLDLAAAGRLDFEAPDPVRFPALRLARAAAEAGGTAPAVLNAANEVAVAAFLGGGLNFPGIPAVIEEVLGALPVCEAQTLEAVLAADAEARRGAVEVIARRTATARGTVEDLLAC
ncbi:MAG: 1-deoxy-D-xylulose-5-phosphate reductoisomerase [Gammaproteobacteria bacterium]